MLLLMLLFMQDPQWTLKSDDSVFAIITQKAGLASGFAHNHLVVAPDPQLKLTLDPENLETLQFEFECESRKLEVDRAEDHSKWYDRIRQLDFFQEKFSFVDESDRAKIKKAMIGKDQLNVTVHPLIQAKVLSFHNQPLTGAPADFTASIELEFRVTGKRINRTLPCRGVEAEGQLQFEVFGSYRFSEFGIKPYSAMLGAVRNQDEFFLYVNAVFVHP